MKRLIPIALALLGLTAQAEVRSVDAMQGIAAAKLSQLKSPALRAKVRSGEKLRVLADRSQLTLFGYDRQGWAIVSKDDRFPAVVAYGDSPLDMDNLSPEFQWLMEGYDRGMAKALTDGGGLVARSAPIQSSVLMPVEPLVQTHWAQSWPYNAKCPRMIIDEGDVQCVTGCVATAFAQVLYYHKAPLTIQGKKSYFWSSEEDGTLRKLTYDFDANPFDWDNMHLTYDSEHSYSQTEVDAIANFMSACGVLANMNYGYNYGSGALTNEVTEAINAYCTDIRSTDHGGSHWSAVDVSLIARELNAGRPLVFSGGDGYGQNGHCFVIDGVDQDGLIHCNLGWAGGGDGYYSPQTPGDYSTFCRLNTVIPCTRVEAAEPLPELAGKLITASTAAPATAVKPNTWYVLYNEGRSVALADDGTEKNVGISPVLPAARRAEYAARALVRFVPSGDKYYLQSGLGNYIPAFTKGLGAKPTQNKQDTYSVKFLNDGHAALVGYNNVVMECGHAIVKGREAQTALEIGGTESWLLYPATVADDPAAKPVQTIENSVAELRMVKGGTAELSASVLPADASVGDVIWASDKAGYASVDSYGIVTARARGTATVTARAADGSKAQGTTAVYVGTLSNVEAVSNLKNTATYLLSNVGYTQGYLIATDTTTAYPQLRGIVQKQATPEWIDPLYWDDPQLGNAYTQWQLMKASDGQFYLYNVGMRQFLSNGAEEKSEYVFSRTPKPVSISVVGSDDFTGASTLAGYFYINGGSNDRSRLCAGTAYPNPAHWVYSTNSGAKKQSVWKLEETNGLATGLDLLTTAQLDELLSTDGVHSAQTRSEAAQTEEYDLAGRALHSGKALKGISIRAGRKIIR